MREALAESNGYFGADTADRSSDRRHGYPAQNLDHCVARQHTYRAASEGGR